MPTSFFDTWIGHFYLGQAYLAAGALHAGRRWPRPVHPAHDGERSSIVCCRRGSDLTRKLPARLLRYQGRVREELKNEGFKESPSRVSQLASAGNSTEDPLVRGVRNRAAS